MNAGEREKKKITDERFRSLMDRAYSESRKAAGRENLSRLENKCLLRHGTASEGCTKTIKTTR